VSSPFKLSPNEPKYDSKAGIFISLGSNLNYLDLSSRALLVAAMERLEAGGDKIVATSSFWQSDAWPAQTGAPSFINAVCQIRPRDHDPAQLLTRMHEVESGFGRLRDQRNRWQARTLDLDLLDYNALISENCSFPVLPHPRIEERDFVLCPLLEVCPKWVHPITQKTGQYLLLELEKLEKTNNCIQMR
jgi:2-amino-4-hydroxy-6-hydroxymethyldihydropteridine diphosphokinase